MFSPRKSQKEVEPQSMLLLTETSYDKGKSAEFHKHVTEVSDDESLDLPYPVMMNITQQLASPSKVGSMTQRFVRLGRKKQSRRDQSSSTVSNDVDTPNGESVILQGSSGNHIQSPTTSSHDRDLEKGPSFDTTGETVLVDDSTSSESAVPNSLSMQSSSNSAQEIECSDTTLSPTTCDTLLVSIFRDFDNLVSVRVVDGAAQIVTLAPGDLSSDDDDDFDPQDDTMVSTDSAALVDLSTIFLSKRIQSTLPSDAATTASFEFSTVDWRTSSQNMGGTLKKNSTTQCHQLTRYQAAEPDRSAVLTDAADVDGDDPFTGNLASTSNDVDDGSFGMHSYSSDFDFLDVSFAEVSHGQMGSSKEAGRSGSLSIIDARASFRQAASHSSLSQDTKQSEVSRRDEDFNLSFNFTSVEWEQPSTRDNMNEKDRKPPLRTGSQLSQESQQRIRDYLMKERKERPSSNQCHSVGHTPGRKSKTSSGRSPRASLRKTARRSSISKIIPPKPKTAAKEATETVDTAASCTRPHQESHIDAPSSRERKADDSSRDVSSPIPPHTSVATTTLDTETDGIQKMRRHQRRTHQRSAREPSSPSRMHADSKEEGRSSITSSPRSKKVKDSSRSPSKASYEASPSSVMPVAASEVAQQRCNAKVAPSTKPSRRSTRRVSSKVGSSNERPQRTTAKESSLV